MSDTCQIDIYGPISKLTGEFPLNAVREATSYAVAGAEFAKAYRKGMWDGRKHLFKTNTGAFPTGLLSLVTHVLDVATVTYDVHDHRKPLAPQGGTYDLLGVKMEGKFDYQLEAAQKAVAAKQGILRVGTGGGKTEISCAITQYLKQPTLFMVTTRELLYQARDRFKKRLGATDAEIGLVGDGIWEPGSWVTIATVATLESRFAQEDCQELLSNARVLFVDECHHAGSDTWYSVCTSCPADYRFGLSGTPMDRTDGANICLLAAIGPIIVDIPNKFLVDRGILARTNVIFSKVTAPMLPKKTTYATAYKQGVVENPNTLALIVEWTKVFTEAGLSTLILCEQIEHGKLIDAALWTAVNGAFIPHLFINGKESTEVRQTGLKDFGERRLPVLIASSILDEGVDVPTIDALILAGSRKSRIKTMQRLGRGLRGDKLIAVEFANYTHDHLLRHSLQRYEDYRKEDCFGLIQSPPDVKLVERLWNAKDKRP